MGPRERADTADTEALNEHVLHARVQKGQRVRRSAAELPPAVKLTPIRPHKETRLGGVIDTAPLRPLISSPGFSPPPVTLAPSFYTTYRLAHRRFVSARRLKCNRAAF